MIDTAFMFSYRPASISCNGPILKSCATKRSCGFRAKSAVVSETALGTGGGVLAGVSVFGFRFIARSFCSRVGVGDAAGVFAPAVLFSSPQEAANRKHRSSAGKIKNLPIYNKYQNVGSWSNRYYMLLRRFYTWRNTNCADFKKRFHTYFFLTKKSIRVGVVEAGLYITLLDRSRRYNRVFYKILQFFTKK
jgi:hypothetical protein